MGTCSSSLDARFVEDDAEHVYKDAETEGELLAGLACAHRATIWRQAEIVKPRLATAAIHTWADSR